MSKPKVLLKISGENISGKGEKCQTREPLLAITKEIASVANDYQIAIVVGGGNIIRGTHYIQNVSHRKNIVPHLMGMAATIINGLALQDFLEEEFGVETRLMSAQENNWLCEKYIARRAIRHMEKGRVAILVGGMGNPNLSTDYAMVMRADELKIDTVYKGTKVNGIFTQDPELFKNLTPEASNKEELKFIPKISHGDYVEIKLKIVDYVAVAQAEVLGITIKVFNCFETGNLRRILSGENIGSVIYLTAA